MKRILIFCIMFAVVAPAATQFSGSSFSTTIATTGTKQDLINSIETALKNGTSGWTTVSGSGTTNLLMSSGTTPQGLQIRARFKDNSGGGIQVYMENSNSTLQDTLTSGYGATLMATVGRTYQVIGSLYQFLIYKDGSDRAVVWVGMPQLPSHLTSVTTAAGWLVSNAYSDSDATSRANLTVGAGLGWASAGNCELLLNSSYWSSTSDTNACNGASSIGSPRLVLNGVGSEFSMTISTANTYRWGDDSVVTGDVYIAWGSTGKTIEAKLRGQVWDAVYIADSVAINTTAVFSSHTFQAVTSGSSGIQQVLVRGGLWFAIN
jgi:hypothetical protein